MPRWLLFSLCVAGLSSPCVPVDPPARLAWEQNSGLKDPAGVAWDRVAERFFVSSMAGPAQRADGNGWISVLSAAGKAVQPQWVKGLSAPKGLWPTKSGLWVCDIQNLVRLDPNTGHTLQRLFIPGSRSLVDVTVSPDGVLYAADSMAGRIYRYQEPLVSVFVQGAHLGRPQAVFWHDGQLIVGASGRVFSLDPKTKTERLLTEGPLGSIAAIDWDGRGFLILDSTHGKVLRVLKDGQVQTVLEGVSGSEAMAWAPEPKLLVLVHGQGQKLSAYSFNEQESAVNAF